MTERCSKLTRERGPSTLVFKFQRIIDAVNMFPWSKWSPHVRSGGQTYRPANGMLSAQEERNH